MMMTDTVTASATVGMEGAFTVTSARTAFHITLRFLHIPKQFICLIMVLGVLLVPLHEDNSTRVGLQHPPQSFRASCAHFVCSMSNANVSAVLVVAVLLVLLSNQQQFFRIRPISGAICSEKLLLAAFTCSSFTGHWPRVQSPLFVAHASKRSSRALFTLSALMGMSNRKVVL